MFKIADMRCNRLKDERTVANCTNTFSCDGFNKKRKSSFIHIIIPLTSAYHAARTFCAAFRA